MEIIDMQINMTENKQDQLQESDFSADNFEFQESQESQENFDEEQSAAEISEELHHDDAPIDSSEDAQDEEANFEHEEQEVQIEEISPEEDSKSAPELLSGNEIAENSHPSLPEKDPESKIPNVPIETNSVQDKDPTAEQLDNTQENAPSEDSHDLVVEIESHHCDEDEQEEQEGEEEEEGEEVFVDDDQEISAANQEDHEQEVVSASIEAQEQDQEIEISISDDQESDAIACEDPIDTASGDVDQKEDDEKVVQNPEDENVAHQDQIPNNKKRKAEDIQEDEEQNQDESEMNPNKRARNSDDKNDNQIPETHLDESEDLDVDVTSVDAESEILETHNEEYIKLTDAQSVLEIEYKGESYPFAGLIESNPDYAGDFRSMEICEMMQEIRGHFGIDQSEDIALSFPDIELFFTSQTISIQKITIEQLYDYTLSVAAHQSCEIPFRAVVSTQQSLLDQISYLNSLPKVEKSTKELIEEEQENGQEEEREEEKISAGDDVQQEQEHEQDDDQEVLVV